MIEFRLRLILAKRPALSAYAAPAGYARFLNSFMRPILLTLITFLFLTFAQAQKAGDVLATANGLTFTVSSLSENARKAYLEQNASVAAERARLYAQLVRDSLIEAESKAQNSTGEALLAAEVKKAAEPTAAEIKTVYDANRSALGNRTIDEVRPQIVTFLKANTEQKAITDLVERLKIKHKFQAGKDVNTFGLKPADTLFSVAGQIVTAADFENRFKAHIYDVGAGIAAVTIADLENTIFSTLVAQEAKARNIETGDLIAAEITNKLRDFTDEERLALENGLKKRLFEKYAVKIAVKEPNPVTHDVSVDDDPVWGKPTAPVTVMMFSDFQCSACSATHPVLKKVITEYGDKVRFVVRDFPLESVHENAFRAALAANAARQQGKFFEYIEILYRNQDSLDAASLNKYAAELGLNLKQFELDLSSEKTAAEVRKDMADAVKHGARGTPTIFINGIKAQRLSADAFRGAIEKALAAAAPK
jgi:protein-disulfide isomerase